MIHLPFAPRVILLLLFAIHNILYLCRYVHVPVIHTCNPTIKSIRLGLIFPAFLVPYGLIQSIYQLFRRIQVNQHCAKEEKVLPVAHDAEILLIKYEPAAMPGCQVTDNILLIHGLNGSANSTYIKGMTNLFLDRGCRVFCYNARGAMHPATSNTFSHHGLTSDIRETVEYIMSGHSGYVSLIGFSLGSNWTAKFMAEYSHPRIRLGVAVCCPFDYDYLRRFFMGTFLRRIVNFFVTRNYKRYLRRSMAEPPDFSCCTYVDQVDECRMGVLGWPALEEFYRDSSCVHYIDRIDKPFLFVNAIDDPIIPQEVVPVDKCLQNHNLGLVLLRGGHLGFFTNRSETVAERIVGDFFDKVRAQGATDYPRMNVHSKNNTVSPHAVLSAGYVNVGNRISGGPRGDCRGRG